MDVHFSPSLFVCAFICVCVSDEILLLGETSASYELTEKIKTETLHSTVKWLRALSFENTFGCVARSMISFQCETLHLFIYLFDALKSHFSVWVYGK